ncbi:MFS transporter [Kitasatospora aureofaciens]|uniref:MFS transporter n=1 Tax=Kitasatospora aureofaciens TaxID=1894 RepID=UPI001C4464F9|nr:MFS transporter [Kitasatospora aureofaciens]MBV6700199.1 MFS transporter [Kitasatospora aureofaciens]
MPTAARLSRAPAFWLVAGTLLLLMFAAAAPSPLYVVYQARWNFSSGMLTTVFAVYALFLLLALMTVGSLSDFLGRKPVLIGALLLEAASMALFAEARGVGWLLTARAVQGLATGAATGALAAALVDLQPASSPGFGALINGAASTLGLAVGAFGSGLLVQYGPSPRTLVFVLLLAAMVAAAAALVRIPETVARRPGALASLLPRARVPREVRKAFVAVLPALIAVWALGGLYLSLAPSLVAALLHVSNHLVGGLVISTMTAVGAVSSIALRARTPRFILALGCAALAVGALGTLAALGAHSVALFFTATAVAGLGFGGTFLGSLSSVVPLTAPGERAELFSTFYVVSYLAFSLPAVAAGFAAPHAGLLRTAVVYGVAVAALALVALALLLTSRRKPDGPAGVAAAASPDGAAAERVPS